MYESRISKELSRKVFELTLALYRVTDFFPQGEALRKQLREKANEVFGGVSEYGYTIDTEREAMGILAKIESTRGYLEIARSHRFIRSINITVLIREYEILANFFTRELDGTKHERQGNERKEEKEHMREEYKRPRTRAQKPGIPKIGLMGDEIKTSGNTLLNDRQKKILSHLKENKEAKISDFYSLFSEISSKTIQRDLQDLVAKSILKKEGEKRWTTYYLGDNVR